MADSSLEHREIVRHTPLEAATDLFRRHWLPLLGAAALIVPTLRMIAKDSWSTEQGAHGPVVLATGIWLVSHMRREWMPLVERGNLAITGLMVVPCLLIYMLGRITTTPEMEGFALYFTLVAATYAYIGLRAMRLLWFPIVYFAFVFPPPDSLVAAVTQPLKLGISQMAVKLLGEVGFPIARTGVIIQVAQYDILVAAACSGLNSIISLSAIGLFYVYIRHNANWRYAMLLMLAILPVAVLANFTRVIVLILLTYYAGDAVAQGFLHGFAGMLMFAVALLGIFGIDMIAGTGAAPARAGGPGMSKLARPSRRDALLGSAMLAAGGIAFARMPRQRTVLIGPKQLDRTVPLKVGPWNFQTASGLVEPPPDELAALLYDQQVARFYAAEDAPPVMLSMAYGSSQGGVLQVHRPEICYPASGFRLSDTQTRQLRISDRTAIPVRFFQARSDTREEQVLYWTRVGDMLPTSWTSQRIAIMRSNLDGTIPDGLLVRLSTIAPSDQIAWETLVRFARLMLAGAGASGRLKLLGSVYGRG